MPDKERLDDGTFLLYCARHYENPMCMETQEFLDDLKRIKYVKKLITRYVDTGELKERLILNHLIVLSNVFGPETLAKIAYLKMRSQLPFVKPFLLLINAMPSRVYNVRGVDYDTSVVLPDEKITEVLRRI